MSTGQAIEVPFVAGIGEEVDRRLLPFGRLRSATNVRFETQGRLSKRPGWTALTMNSLGGGALSLIAGGAVRLAKRQSERLLVDEKFLFRYLPDEDEWYSATTETVPECAGVTSQVVSAANGLGLLQTGVCHDSTSGLTLLAWVDGNYDVSYRVIDETTQSTMLEGTLTATADGALVCWSGGGYLYFGWADVAGGDIYLYRYDTTAPETAPALTRTITDLDTTAGKWDAYYVGTSGAEVLIAYYNSSGDVHVAICNEALAEQSYQDVTDTVVATGDITVCGDSTTRVYCAWITATAISATSWLAADMSDGQTPSTLLGSPSGVLPLTSRMVGTTVCNFYWCDATVLTGSAIPQWSTYSRALTGATPALGGTVHQHGGKIVSRPFYNSTLGRWYYWITTYDQSGSVNRQRVLVEDNPTSFAGMRPVARVSYRVASLAPSVSRATNVATTAKDTWLWSNREIVYGLVTSTAALYGAAIHRYTMTGYDRCQTVELGNELVMAAAIPHYWDGRQLAEIGFLYPPVHVTAASSGAGSLTGDYQYYCAYRLVDNLGREHYSALSPVATVSSLSSNGALVKAPPLQVTSRIVQQCEVVFYRNEASGTVFYEAGSVVCPVGGTAPVQFTDIAPDTALATQRPLYTMAGVPEPFTPPNSDLLCEHDGRVFLGCGSRVYYSHKLADGEAPTFVETFYFDAPDTVTALHTMDSALAVFTQDSIYLMSGQGPDRLGQGVYSGLQRVSARTGCVSSLSVTLLPLGLVFQSDRGIEMVSRARLEVSEIGAGVQDTLETYPRVTGVAVNRETSELMVAVDNGTTGAAGALLVYQYDVGQWSKWTVPQRWTSLAEWPSGEMVLASASALGVWKLGTGYSDPGSAHITLTVETGDIRPGGAMAYQRLMRINLLGEHRANHDMTLSVAYNGSDTYTDSVTWVNTGTAGTALRREYAPSKHKLESIRIKIVDAVDTATSTANEGPALNVLGLVVKPKRGPSKRASAERG